MKQLKSAESQFLKCIAFTKEDTQLFKEVARSKGYTMPRLYHDAVIKGVCLIAGSCAKEEPCQK